MPTAALTDARQGDLHYAAEQRMERIRDQVALRLRAHMDERGLSLRQVAKATSIDLNCLFRMTKTDPEHGKPRLDRIHLVLEYLGLTWGDVDRPQQIITPGLAELRHVIGRCTLDNHGRLVMGAAVDALWVALVEVQR